MKAFTINLKDFFRLDSQNGVDCNFDPTKRKLLIPLYQREYKWTKEKVRVLINDINQRDKFLGIVILDETEKCYEIVDGQQRITTCFLALIALYNHYKGSEMEQETILSFIKPYGDYILHNDSIGEYLIHRDGQISIQIMCDKDIYFQEKSFKDSYDLISSFLEDLSRYAPAKVREFKRQLLDCEILVMINNQRKETCPVEQIFLDINEKSQLLEVEDIFKGHCFENFDSAKHGELRDRWADLKSCGAYFAEKFGFKDLSHYLYLYLLECVSKDMPENLSPGSIHYLEGKNMDETFLCLKDMINYGNSIRLFRNNLDKPEYSFADLCTKSYDSKNTDDIKFLKIISSQILDCKTAQYQKLPFMQFVSFLLSLDIFKNADHSDLRKAIINMYIYASVFVCTGGKKSKSDVDQSVYLALKTASVENVVDATKTLRIEKVKTFQLSDKAKQEALRFVYTISDFYDSNGSKLTQLYVNNTNFTPEHFLIPDNKYKHVIWESGTKKEDLYFKDYAAEKKKTINFLIVDKLLNESIQEYDIVTKIKMIKEWHQKREKDLPKHVDVVIKAIENMHEYQVLKKQKDNPALNKDDLERLYRAFLDAYFNQEAEARLLSSLTECFQAAFRNDKA